MPAENDKNEWSTHFVSPLTIITLTKYCGDAMTYTKGSGKKLEAFMFKTMRQLEVVKTLVWTLRGYDRNEADVAELFKLPWEIEKDLNIERFGTRRSH